MPDDEKPRSPGGSVIQRYERHERQWQPAAREESFAEAVEEHFQELGVEVQTVLHEVISDLVHVDVHISQPTPQREFYLLFTTGMSDLPMTVPEGRDEYRYAELMIGLPLDWPMAEPGQVATGETPYHWPIGILKTLARFPHEYQTWLGAGHTIPNGDPPAPFDEHTKLCGALVAPPLILPARAHQVDVGAGRVVNLYGVVFLHQSEMDFKLAKGADALYDLLDKKKVNEILDPTRPPVTKRGLFSIF